MGREWERAKLTFRELQFHTLQSVELAGVGNAPVPSNAYHDATKGWTDAEVELEALPAHFAAIPAAYRSRVCFAISRPASSSLRPASAVPSFGSWSRNTGSCRPSMFRSES